LRLQAATLDADYLRSTADAAGLRDALDRAIVEAAAK
jgi:hypothetical protein